MILAVLRGEGALSNCRYRRGRTRWKIQPKAEQPHTKWEASFKDIKGGVNSSLLPTKAQAYWISQETWLIVDR